MVNVDGSNLTRLTHTELASNHNPVWSPDSTRIAFERVFSFEDNMREIWVLNADGSAQTRVSNGSGAATIPLRSPDGTRISFWGQRCSDGGDWGIFVVNTDGSNQLCLSDGRAHYSWSPDGSKIALEKDNEIHVMNADGTDVLRLTPQNGVGKQYPSWSPEGSRIVFQQGSGAIADLYVINIDGSDMNRLTEHRAEDTRPTWAPSSVSVPMPVAVQTPTVPPSVTLSPTTTPTMSLQ